MNRNKSSSLIFGRICALVVCAAPVLVGAQLAGGAAGEHERPAISVMTKNTEVLIMLVGALAATAKDREITVSNLRFENPGSPCRGNVPGNNNPC